MNHNTVTEDNVNALNEAKLTVLLAEYNTLREEIISIERSMQELALISLASVGALATLVVTLLDQSPELLLSLLIVLPLPFAAMLFSFLGQINALTNAGRYIANYIEPEVRKIIGDDNNRMFLWQSLHFRSNVYRGIRGFLSSGYWALGQGWIIAFPIAASLFSAWFVMNTNNVSVSQFALWQLLAIAVDIGVIGVLVISIFATLYGYGYLRSQ